MAEHHAFMTSSIIFFDWGGEKMEREIDAAELRACAETQHAVCQAYVPREFPSGSTIIIHAGSFVPAWRIAPNLSSHLSWTANEL